MTMKTIEVDEDLYRYIASHTQHIGENASDILRRLLSFTPTKPLSELFDKTGKASTDIRVQVLHELLLSEHYREQCKAISRFMLVLSSLYTLNAGEFARAIRSLHGRKRAYFASDSQTLQRHGVQTKPRQVPGTPWWVITNTNTDRKRMMVQHIMCAMQIPADLTEKVCTTL